ncbi:MAG: hypothetical protein EAY75_13160 [Bacteroidetes bacterium]|nr:MAG: hypothetical protein EAY75_13160 [Bacteroidota bacterium]
MLVVSGGWFAIALTQLFILAMHQFAFIGGGIFLIHADKVDLILALVADFFNFFLSNAPIAYF